jgi:hypothetical protein
MGSLFGLGEAARTQAALQQFRPELYDLLARLGWK